VKEFMNFAAGDGGASHIKFTNRQIEKGRAKRDDYRRKFSAYILAHKSGLLTRFLSGKSKKLCEMHGPEKKPKTQYKRRIGSFILL
jgi:hypothetical protein